MLSREDNVGEPGSKVAEFAAAVQVVEDAAENYDKSLEGVHPAPVRDGEALGKDSVSGVVTVSSLDAELLTRWDELKVTDSS